MESTYNVDGPVIFEDFFGTIDNIADIRMGTSRYNNKPVDSFTDPGRIVRYGSRLVRTVFFL